MNSPATSVACLMHVDRRPSLGCSFRGKIAESHFWSFATLSPRQRTCSVGTAMSELCRFCCKSRKSNNPKNFARVDLWTSLLLHRFSAPLRRFVIDFGSTHMVPHIAARKTHQRL